MPSYTEVSPRHRDKNRITCVGFNIHEYEEVRRCQQ